MSSLGKYEKLVGNFVPLHAVSAYILACFALISGEILKSGLKSDGSFLPDPSRQSLVQGPSAPLRHFT